jgi:hypothetical protein
VSGGGVSFGSLGLYVGSDWELRCHTYADRPPILAIDAGECSVTVHTTDGTPLESMAAFARELATAAQKYAGECERLQRAAGSSDQAGGTAA